MRFDDQHRRAFGGWSAVGWWRSEGGLWHCCHDTSLFDGVSEEEEEEEDTAVDDDRDRDDDSDADGDGDWLARVV